MPTHSRLPIYPAIPNRSPRKTADLRTTNNDTNSFSRLHPFTIPGTTFTMNNLRYRKAWRFPGPVERFIGSLCTGFIIHIANGDSTFGSLRLDMYSANTDIKADFFALPFKDDIADTVLCDPPWHMNNNHKPRLLRELRRVLKFGGRLVFNSTWSPKCAGLRVDTIWVPEYQLMSGSHLSLIFQCTKLKTRLL